MCFILFCLFTEFTFKRNYSVFTFFMSCWERKKNHCKYVSNSDKTISSGFLSFRGVCRWIFSQAAYPFPVFVSVRYVFLPPAGSLLLYRNRRISFPSALFSNCSLHYFTIICPHNMANWTFFFVPQTPLRRWWRLIMTDSWCSARPCASHLSQLFHTAVWIVMPAVLLPAVWAFWGWCTPAMSR